MSAPAANMTTTTTTTKTGTATSDSASQGATENASASKSDPTPPSIPASSTTSAASQQPASTQTQQSTTTSSSPSEKRSSSPTSAASRLWSSFNSPSESSSKAASAALEEDEARAARRLKRRPTYEEFRAQEPPQARLIRLRGLFDVLLDKDDESALAGGRAKEEWTRSAMRARYGAGGALARGSLAPNDAAHQSIAAFITGATSSTTDKEKDPSSSSGSTNPNTSASVATSSTASSLSGISARPPRQSYARELLNQCRECRAQLEAEREREAKRASKKAAGEAHGSSAGEGESSWSSWIPFAGGAAAAASSTEGKDADKGKDKASASLAEEEGITSKIASYLPFGSSSGAATESGQGKGTSSSSSDSGSGSGIWSSAASLIGLGSSESSSSSSASSTQGLDLGSDHEGEAGWVGSGVWGLSAVGSKQRQLDRERDEKIREGQDVEDDGGKRQRQIEWEGFLRYAEGKERELYGIFMELDKNGDMRLDVSEIRLALDRAGIQLPQASLNDFIASLASSPRAHQGPEPGSISFPQFRDYLLLLPRNPSVNEIFRFYQVRKAFGLFGAQGIFAEFSEHWGRSERHGATAVTPDGDVSLAGEEKKKSSGSAAGVLSSESKDGAEDKRDGQRGATAVEGKTEKGTSSGQVGGSASSDGSASSSAAQATSTDAAPGVGQEEEEEDESDMIDGTVAMKFLLAGGIAGAVSRTATAPFDRLKIYLITTAHKAGQAGPMGGGVGGAAAAAASAAAEASKAATSKQLGKAAAKAPVGLLSEAIRTLYRDGGGLKAFWLGNGLNCLKIFPESAIKFLSYETSKRAFAKYVDHVQDSRDISGSSRFISGGMGGITSQLAIYPVETLKTRLMSSQNSAPGSLKGNALLAATAKDMWSKGGLRLYYRGLTAGLIGVFPYSAIDMSTFEGIKLFWIRYSGKEEPSVLALLAFGSFSGSVGATTVYPLNLIRTRLQAAGTPAHPQTYEGFMDAMLKTYRSEGMVGFYRGLVPTLAKVVPAVSLSYVAYEHSKKHLGVQ